MAKSMMKRALEQLGRRGQRAYMAATTPEQRQEWARKAIRKRWARVRAAARAAGNAID